MRRSKQPAPPPPPPGTKQLRAAATAYAASGTSTDLAELRHLLRLHDAGKKRDAQERHEADRALTRRREEMLDGYLDGGGLEPE